MGYKILLSSMLAMKAAIILVVVLLVLGGLAYYFLGGLQEASVKEFRLKGVAGLNSEAFTLAGDLVVSNPSRVAIPYDKIDYTVVLLAPNKSIAKMASEMNKPDGLTIVRPEQVRGFLDPLPVDKISGVGKKTAEFLRGMNVETIGQLSQVPAKKLTEWFGKGGVWLWAIASGLEETPVEERPLRKSISVEQTFERDVRNKALVREALDALVVEVHERLLNEGLMFRTVGIKVRFEGFDTFTREKTHTGYVDNRGVVTEYVKMLFREFERDPRKVRLVGVRLSDLKPAEGHQVRLG